MWDYVFSPRLMMIDAIAGLIAWVGFRVLRGRNPVTLLDWFVMSAIVLVLRHAAPGGALPLPGGDAGQIARACLREASEDECRCAVAALEHRIGRAGLVEIAVHMRFDTQLPPELDDALARCRDQAAG